MSDAGTQTQTEAPNICPTIGDEAAKGKRSLKSQLDSMTRTKWTPFCREQQLRKEAKEMKEFATTGTVSLDSYRTQIGQIDRLTVAVAAAEKQARDKEEEGRLAVERVQGDLTRLTLGRALEGQRMAERKLEESEKKARECVAAVGQLEQSLGKARDEVRLFSDSDQSLQQRLDTLRAQLKDATSQASEQYQDGYLAGIAARAVV
ncbi:hypothetical protein BDR22DRAFT_895176 [Usnea florida]